MHQDAKDAALCVSSWYKVKRKMDHLLSLEEGGLFCPVCLETKEKCQHREHRLVSSVPYISLDMALDTARWWLSVFSSEASPICINEPESYTESPKPVLPYPDSISMDAVANVMPDYNYTLVTIPVESIFGFTSNGSCYTLAGDEVDINKPKYAFNVSGASTVAWGGIVTDKNRRWFPIAWFSDGGWVVGGDTVPIHHMAIFPEGLPIKSAVSKLVPELKTQPREFLLYPAGFSGTLEMYERSLRITWFT